MILKLGDRVRSQHGVVGTVVPAGPYGDEPFQIKTDDGGYCSFVNEDGTNAFGARWTKLNHMTQKATRQEVFSAVSEECEYARTRWNADTTTSAGNHSPQEWLSYIEHYARGGIHVGCVKADQDALPEQLAILRKIACLAVSAMENCGVQKRIQK